jgi:hypothetical protein
MAGEKTLEMNVLDRLSGHAAACVCHSGTLPKDTGTDQSTMFCLIASLI